MGRGFKRVEGKERGEGRKWQGGGGAVMSAHILMLWAFFYCYQKPTRACRMYVECRNPLQITVCSKIALSS
jgi:hypothetical protein